MPDYDEIAIREAIVNALIHRQYSNVGAEVTIDIYDNRIEVTSPGAIVSGKIGNIDGRVPSVRRNPILADIFARMKYMDRRGSGFEKIKNNTNSLFKDNKNHAKFYSAETHFSVIIDNANYKHDTQNDTQKLLIQKIVLLIRENSKISREEMAIKCGVSKATITRQLKKMDNITYVGSSKKGHWEIR